MQTRSKLVNTAYYRSKSIVRLRIIQSTSLIKIILTTATLGLGLCFNLAFAQAITSDEENQLTSILKSYGQEVQTSADFYKAGIPCHDNKLDKIVYIRNKRYMYLFFNDTLGNCNLASIDFGLAPKNKKPIAGGCICKISTTVYNEIYTPWSLNALKTFDLTQQINPGFKQLANDVHNCLITNVVPISNVIFNVQTSIQATAKNSP